jgi:hypothetical protein
MRRGTLPDPPPEQAEVYKGLKLWTEDVSREGCESSYLTCKAWRGKSQRPYAFFQFHSIEQRSTWMAQQRSAEDSRIKAKEERKKAKAEGLEAMRERLQVGSILYTSWGYDQTNVEFFEVVERKPASVVVREIEGELEERGFMSGRTRPKPGKYIGEPLRKLITDTGITFESYRSAWPTDPEKWHGCSWYA